MTAIDRSQAVLGGAADRDTTAAFEAALSRARSASQADPSNDAAAPVGLVDGTVGPGWAGLALGHDKVSCPSSLDTNGDGRIGLDELLIAMGILDTGDQDIKGPAAA